MAESSDNEDNLCSILTPDEVAEDNVTENNAESVPEHVDSSGEPLVKRVHGRRAAQKPTDTKLVMIVLLAVVAAGLTAKIGLQASVLQKQQAQIDGLFAQLRAKPQAEANAAASHAAGPSSEELFRLNSECATLGKKFLDENHLKCKSAGCTENATSAGPVQGGGYQTVKGDNITDATQVSHYDPAANRCYIELTEYTINSKTSDTKLTVGLYDAQTGEKIASYGDAGSKSTDQDYWGTVTDPHHQHVFKSALNDEEDAKAYIGAKMGR